MSERLEAERRVERETAEAVKGAKASADESYFWRRTHDGIVEYVDALRTAAKKEDWAAREGEPAWRGVRRLPGLLDRVLVTGPAEARSFRERNPSIVGPAAGAGAWLQEALEGVEPASWIVTAPEIKYAIFVEALQRQPDWKEPETGPE
jgi:hypothetical protein